MTKQVNKEKQKHQRKSLVFQFKRYVMYYCLYVYSKFALSYSQSADTSRSFVKAALLSRTLSKVNFKN